jgi:hypothetical protein
MVEVPTSLDQQFLDITIGRNSEARPAGIENDVRCAAI